MHDREAIELFLLGRGEGMSVREAVALTGGDQRGGGTLGAR